MKNRCAMIFLALVVTLTSACATLGRFGPGYDSFNRGLSLFNQGRFAESVEHFEDATRRDPEFAEAYLYLGRAYISQSRRREPKKFFDAEVIRALSAASHHATRRQAPR
jgi:tetratricopeptide (TPR) repeat protein